MQLHCSCWRMSPCGIIVLFRLKGQLRSLSSTPQVSNFWFKITWLFLSTKAGWKTIIVPRILWRSYFKDSCLYKLQCLYWRTQNPPKCNIPVKWIFFYLKDRIVKTKNFISIRWLPQIWPVNWVMKKCEDICILDSSSNRLLIVD